MAAGNRRRKMWIDTPEQLVFGARSTVHVLIFMLAAAILIYGPGEGGMRLSEAQRTTNEFLFHISDRLWLILPALGLVWLVGVIGSHRVVGPVFGYKRALSDMLEKDLTARALPRKGDHFIELGELMNDAIAAQQALLGGLRAGLSEISAGLGESGEPADLEKARRAAKDAEAVLAEYKL